MRLVESSSRFSSLFEHDLRANAFPVCREGKPLHTFRDHALAWADASQRPNQCLSAVVSPLAVRSPTGRLAAMVVRGRCRAGCHAADPAMGELAWSPFDRWH